MADELRGEDLVHQTRLIFLLFIENQESERHVYIGVRGIDLSPVPTTFTIRF